MTVLLPAPAARVDVACAAAVDLARAAAVEDGGPAVGEHLGVAAETGAERVATHLFACTEPAYRDWRWSVTVARAARAKVVTVDEVALLPGPDALVPPPWVPWSERLRPGDLGVGDLLPTADDDDRLVPAYATYDPDDPDEVAVVTEVGLGRVRVLSTEGRLDAAERWYDGEQGPGDPIAKAAPGRCVSCGFLLRLAGPLRQGFGVCANEYARDDGRVVAFEHGCGAHSEAAAAVVEASPQPVVAAPVDEYGFDLVSVHTPSGLGSVADAEPAEPFGHS